MSYKRTTWVNGETPINADNLNNIEAGIVAIEENIGAIADYVVEEGSNSYGSYSKWNSGKAEVFFGHYSSSGLTTASWVSPIYYKDMTTWTNVFNKIRNGIFIESPRLIVQSSESQIISVVYYNLTAAGATMRFLTAGAKTDVAYGFQAYASGKWK
ncbi:MAG: hypothetical protein ACI4LK_02310 [Lentihominibacter sp.]